MARGRIEEWIWKSERMMEEEEWCVCAWDGCGMRWDKKNTILLLCYAYVIKIVINIKLLSQSR